MRDIQRLVFVTAIGLLVAAGAPEILTAQETRPFEETEEPREDTPETPPPPPQTSPRPSQMDRDARRLFQRFAEDAAIIPGGWTEGSVSYEHVDHGVERGNLNGLFAFGLGKANEAGVRIGFEYLNAESPDPDGSGLDDIDVYFKHRLISGESPCALGGLMKLGVASEDEGLGTGKPDFEFFTACRADLRGATFAGNVGARYNGQPDPPLPDAEISFLAGGAIILPTGNEVSVIIEATWESERLDGFGNDARLTIGLQGVATRPGFGFRGALALPLTDATPDYQILFGAVYLY